ncbi:MAG: amidohydrolase [Lentisphaerae bacterium]|jgi:L-fuconolactonase|nr:amidohydrolase [Lentisphaerota bacterium]MBT4821357.1 amidohydrolase [Lentisphaerota bacterium]MBT5612557.1 amidohydrolase [Lentisphaerota bacterium]MBT7061352.1 amidohydrolase [Lentisphaerota bacterium]MBT7840493.1 amidohydrolase [Lentisphaerota bacterium]
MRLIDAHVHILDDYPPLRPFEDLGRCDRLLHLMDDAGVEKAIVLPVVADFAPRNNEQCAQWALDHPDRLVNLADVQLHESDAAIAVARARHELAAVGVSYYPSSADIAWMLGPPCDPLWEALSEHDMVCNLQVTAPNYVVLLELATRYPDIRFVANHLGLPHTLEGDDAGYARLLVGGDLPNLFVKASAFYAAAAAPWDMRCPRALGFFAQLLEAFGPAKLLWGTDWPPVGRHLTYRQSLDIVRTFAAGLSDDDRALILGGNAACVYGA